MNRYLLDTSTVLIAQTDPALLAPAVHEALLRGISFTRPGHRCPPI